MIKNMPKLDIFYKCTNRQAERPVRVRSQEAKSGVGRVYQENKCKGVHMYT
jgi:hypothetical protein